MNDQSNYEEYDIPRPFAPNREQIGAIESSETLWDMLSDATDIEISIKTQLEFLDDGIEMRHRRVGALIYWRQACKNLKSRLNQVADAAARQKVV